MTQAANQITGQHKGLARDLVGSLGRGYIDVNSGICREKHEMSDLQRENLRIRTKNIEYRNLQRESLRIWTKIIEY